MAELDVPAERCAAAEPVSTLDGHSLLVTEFVPGVPRTQRREAVVRAGGLRGVGALLGRIHALAAAPAVLARPGGAWHHLADGAPRDEIAALGRLLRTSPPEVSAALENEVARLDDASGLPESFVHPDFALPNIVAPATGGLVLVDWTGAGRAPRMWSLAFALWAAGVGGDLSRVERVLAGYRRHIAPEPAELERLEALIRVRPTVFNTWAVCNGRKTLDQAEAGIAASYDAAAAIAACARAFIAAH